MHGNRFVLKLNDDLYALSLRTRGKIQQRMLVETELSENPVETGVGRLRHEMIVK
jgi:hypothetical protein